MILSSLSRVIVPTLSRPLFMMAKQYHDMIDFTLKDSDIPTPKKICEAAANAAEAGYTRFAPNIGEISYQAPLGTFYFFIDISRTEKDSKSFCFELLEKEHLPAIPGIAFDGAYDSYVRLAYSLNDDKIKEGINRITRYIRSI